MVWIESTLSYNPILGRQPRVPYKMSIGTVNEAFLRRKIEGTTHTMDDIAKGGGYLFPLSFLLLPTRKGDILRAQP